MKLLFRVDPQVIGTGSVRFSWHPQGNLLAVCGSNRMVHIYDRNGAHIDQMALTGSSCLQLEWDSEGDVLAVLQSGVPSLLLWDSNSRRSQQLEIQLKGDRELHWCQWARSQPLLAIGTGKGNLVLYNRKTSRKETIYGKHTKKITSGSWNQAGLLALGSADRIVTISNMAGETIESVELKSEPCDVMFAQMKRDAEKSDEDTTVTASLLNKTLFLYDLNDRENPFELAFHEQYGALVKYQWFGDGYIVLGFQSGYVIVISTHEQEIGSELFNQKCHASELSDIAANIVVQRAASVGEQTVRVIDLAQWKDVGADRIDIDEVDGPGDHVGFSKDGQILTVTTKRGVVLNYLAKLPAVAAAFETRVVYLSSLRELTVMDYVDPSSANFTVGPLQIEPALVAIGPAHAAVAMNNRVWMYSAIRGQTSRLIGENEFAGSISSLALNDKYLCVLSHGQITLRALDPREVSADRRSLTIPDSQTHVDTHVTTVTLLTDFLVYTTADNQLVQFCLSEWANVNEYKHSCPLKNVYPNSIGTRVVLHDEQNEGYVYNPISDECTGILNFSSSCTHVLWDLFDWGVFLVCDANSYHTFCYIPHSIAGAKCTYVGETRRSHGHIPLSLHNGHVAALTQTGAVVTLQLKTHEYLSDEFASVQGKNRFMQQLSLNRLKDAWETAYNLGSLEQWQYLGKTAVEQLDLPLAIQTFRMMGDAGMVAALSRILSQTEETSLIAGHVALLAGDYDVAQQRFLSSPSQEARLAALDMRVDLLHWDQALNLARTLAPERLPGIARMQAQQLEAGSQYQQALNMFETALQYASGSSDELDAPHVAACKGGIARNTVRVGDVSRGVQMALATEDAQVMKECAGILEGMKQLGDAALLYEKAGVLDRAASIYIQIRNWKAAAPLMKHIKAPKLLLLFAKAKESEGRFAEAASAYEAARDWDSLVRLLLDKLKEPGRAFDIVRKNRSAEGAQMVSRFCVQIKDFRAALEFLLLAKRNDEAFALAQQHNTMDRYAELLGDEATPEDWIKVAQFFESRGESGQAGRYYAHASNYVRALSLLIQAGEDYLDDAIDVVGHSRNRQLTNQLEQYLLGEIDGTRKDPKYLFRLYMVLGNYHKSAEVAMDMGRKQMATGKYKDAHDLLLNMYRELEAQHIDVPSELGHNLMLLHSYVLVKDLIKRGDHVGAALMLVRVAKHISKFSNHVVPILTSTVIECQRAGLKRVAYEYASMLMQPEYRQQINSQYKRKIEAVVRRPDRSEDPQHVSPCPFCKFELENTQLDCPSCKNQVPYCIVTGLHMVAHDWCECPSCHFSASYSQLVEVAGNEGRCPMCNNEIVSAAIVKIQDPVAALQRKQQQRRELQERDSQEAAAESSSS